MAAVKADTKKRSAVLTVLLLALVVYFLATIISTQAKVNAQERTNAELSQKYEDQLKENEALSDVAQSGNEGDYMERIAREEYGYAMPDERVYEDSAVS